MRTSFELHPKEGEKDQGVIPVCSLWNSVNGNAYFESDGLKVLIRPYSSGKPVLFGPLLLPIIPSALFNPFHYSAKIHSSIGIEVAPPKQKAVKIDLSKQALFYDDSRIEFGESATYSRRTERTGELARGVLDFKTDGQFKHDKAFSLQLHGDHREAPEKIRFDLEVVIDEKVIKRTFEFSRKYEWDYLPIWVPTQHTDERCKKRLPDSDDDHFMKRSLVF